MDEEEAEEEGQLIVVDELFEDEEEEVDENADVPKAFNAFDGNSHESSRKVARILHISPSVIHTLVLNPTNQTW